MISDFSKFKKIDAHSHIGKFGSPFDVDFDAAMLTLENITKNSGKIVEFLSRSHDKSQYFTISQNLNRK